MLRSEALLATLRSLATKHESQSSKSETNPKYERPNDPNNDGPRPLSFWSFQFEILGLFRISDLALRISLAGIGKLFIGRP